MHTMDVDKGNNECDKELNDHINNANMSDASNGELDEGWENQDADADDRTN